MEITLHLENSDRCVKTTAYCFPVAVQRRFNEDQGLIDAHFKLGSFLLVMDTESPLLSFIKSSLPKLRDSEPLLEHLQGLGVEDLEDLSYLQESDLLSVLRPIEARKLLSLLKKTSQQDVFDSPPINQSNQQFSRASTSTSPVTQSDEMALSGASSR
ncbi:uncharacterized protein LOC115588355 [Sparus aurata]|uniref:uncharacterized protein LOC115588355 n=1 Tax=Sparus aurata TaxID=8175 RepID=UPI0011C0EC19|nr:uncharacterized protein LOC115588355 [Sparus aurata]